MNHFYPVFLWLSSGLGLSDSFHVKAWGYRFVDETTEVKHLSHDFLSDVT